MSTLVNTILLGSCVICDAATVGRRTLVGHLPRPVPTPQPKCCGPSCTSSWLQARPSLAVNSLAVTFYAVIFVAVTCLTPTSLAVISLTIMLLAVTSLVETYLAVTFIVTTSLAVISLSEPFI